jgi:hypothetical protein
VAPPQSANPDDDTGPADAGPDRNDPVAARLLLALTSLYVQRPVHAAEEQQQYVELVLRLIDRAGPATCAAAAAMLGRHPDAPDGIVERLGGPPCSDGDRAGDDGVNGSPSHAAPDRHATGDPPAESDPPPESDQSAANRGCEPAPALSDAAPEVPPAALTSEIGEAFFTASPAERRQVLSLLAMRGGAEAALESSRRFHVRIDPSAWRGRTDTFARDFERLIDAPRGLCERILNDPSGEPMVVAARATGMPVAILQRILLLISPATNHSVQHVYELTDLYHGLDTGTARELLAVWRRQADAGGRPPSTALAVVRNARGTNLRARFAALNARLQKPAVRSRDSRQD